MTRVIPITSATVVDLRARLTRSVAHADAIDLGETMELLGSEIRGCGTDIRQLALLDDEPSIFDLANALAALTAAERAICVYAVARGMRLAMAPVALPADCEPEAS